MSTETLHPNGAGSNSNSNLHGDAATRWEAMADDTDANYVDGHVNSYILDTYAIADTIIPAGSVINSVTVKTRVATSLTGYAAYSKAALKSGATVYYGDEVTVTSSTYADKTYTWNTNPADSAVFEVSDLNGLEAGIALKATLGFASKATHCEMIVDYTLATGGRMCQVIIC